MQPNSHTPPTFVDIDDIAGKTVKSVTGRPVAYDPCYLIFFTDGTYTQMETDRDAYEDSVSLVSRPVKLNDHMNDQGVALGFWTQEGIAEELRRREQSRRDAALAERRRQYEALKREFEGGSK